MFKMRSNMKSHARRQVLRAFGLAGVVFCAAIAASAQTPHGYPFRATNYEVDVILHPEAQTLTGEAKVDFVASEVSRTVLVELHPDLTVTSVKTAAGQRVTYARDNNSPLLLSVALPESATPGKQVSLIFEYTGPVSSEDDSPTKGVRFASIDKTAAYLLMPARWFPLTDYPSNRYTGTFKIQVPSTFAVVGTGKADSPNIKPGLTKADPGSGRVRIPLRRTRACGNFRRRRAAIDSRADGRLRRAGVHAARAGGDGECVCYFPCAHFELLLRYLWAA